MSTGRAARAADLTSGPAPAGLGTVRLEVRWRLVPTTMRHRWGAWCSIKARLEEVKLATNFKGASANRRPDPGWAPPPRNCFLS